MSVRHIEFLVEVGIAATALNTILLVFVLLFIMAVHKRIDKQADSIKFIHKRAKVAERREDSLLKQAANDKRHGTMKKVEKK